MSKVSSEVPAIVLVMNRETGEIVDCEKHAYGPYVNDLYDKHDMTKHDIVVRQAAVVAGLEEIPEYVEPAPVATLDDIPF